MKRFYCGCGHEIYFDNTFCSACGSQIGFEPSSQTLISFSEANAQPFRFCAHRENELHCNWLLPDDDANHQCLSCRMTRQIPMLNSSDNWRRWRTLEAAKRRMLYGLLILGLPLEGEAKSDSRLCFDFLEDKRTNPDVAIEHVLSGHASGVITINAAEADGSFREAAKEAMNEPYRTLLGHFRHEVGHFFWDRLIDQTQNHDGFQRVFGDDKQDYRGALDYHYANGPVDNWQKHYISAYASAHPLEDWAETWAHYLLMRETIETALQYGLVPPVEQDQSFDDWHKEWLQLVIIMNALNRSTGHADAYPFLISDVVKQKLMFIHDLVNNYQ